MFGVRHRVQVKFDYHELRLTITPKNASCINCQRPELLADQQTPTKTAKRGSKLRCTFIRKLHCHMEAGKKQDQVSTINELTKAS